MMQAGELADELKFRRKQTEETKPCKQTLRLSPDELIEQCSKHLAKDPTHIKTLVTRAGAYAKKGMLSVDPVLTPVPTNWCSF